MRRKRFTEDQIIASCVRKPARNSYFESFEGKKRDGMLNELFFTLDQAWQAVAEWPEDHKTERPRSSLAYATPAA